MKTSGIFFLRGRPASTSFQSPTAGSVTGWTFLLGERHSQRGVQTLIAYWRGQDADQFLQAHPALKAGDCLDLELDRLHVADTELCGFVTRCALAPERWPGRGEATIGAPASTVTEATRAGGHFIDCGRQPMSFPIVPLARIEREAKDAAERGLSLNDACPYSFYETAGVEFKRIFNSHLAARRALGLSSEPTP
jgi:hypothetical protein